MSQRSCMVALFLLATVSVLAQSTAPKKYSFDSLYQDPRRINTAGWEDSPHLTADGKALYFMYTATSFWDWLMCTPTGKSPTECAKLISVRGPQRPGHVGHPNPWRDSNMYMALRLSSGGWSAPAAVMAGCCMMPTRSGRRIYFSKEDPNSRGKTDIAYSERTGSAWGQPILIDALNSPHAEANPHISADEQTIYFTSDRPGGLGGRDLYVARRTSDGWNSPENMGPAFNTKHKEDQIWVSSDGRRAYFNRGGGFFFSERIKHGWTRGRYVSPEFGLTREDYAGEISFNEEETLAVFALNTPERRDLVIVYCVKGADGKWSRPRSVDEMGNGSVAP